jgi:dihydroorotase
MPNTDPPIDTPKVVELVASLGADAGLVDVVPGAALTAGRAGHAASDIEQLYEAGVRVFTDDGDSVEDRQLLEDIMRTVAALPGALVAQHAEDVSLTRDGHMHAGAVSVRLGVGGLPSEAEAEVVRRDIDLVRRTGARYHSQHVSSKLTVEVIRAAKAEGLPVTAEVTPHHLSFTEEDVSSLDTNFKMYPPLRSDQDRRALLQALRDGTIDAVATDHAPHQHDEKDVEFALAPRGVIGLETAASVVWGALRDPDALFGVLSSTPASIAGLSGHGQAARVGNRANLVVFAPEEKWMVLSFRSKSANSPYLGRKVSGRVRATVHDGRVSYQVGER